MSGKSALWVLGLLILGVVAPPSTARGEEATLMRAANRTGVVVYVPGAWGLVDVEVVNRDTTARTAIATNWFKSAEEKQFATSTWVPAKSVRHLGQPVRLPTEVASGAHALDIETRLLRVGTANDEVIATVSPGAIPLVANRPTVAMTLGNQNELKDGDTQALGLSAKLAAGWPRAISYLAPNALPARSVGYDALDILIVASEHPDLEPAQLAALREWVLTGGRLWIMLDRVPADFARALLHDDWNLDVIDRVELPSVRLAGLPPVGQRFAGAGGPEAVPGRATADREMVERPIRDFDDPVELLRVFAPDMRVLFEANGWPAALTKELGHGQLLVTTLGPRGWIEAPEKASEPLNRLADAFLRLPSPPPLKPMQLSPYLAGQIGYDIVGRRSVLVVMIVFIVLMLAAGAFLWPMNRLEWLGPVGVAVAVVVTVVFLAMGSLNRKKVPLLQASAQMVRAVPTENRVAVQSLVNLYSPEKSLSPAPVSGARGGWAWPDKATQDPSLRVLWTDADRWEWQQFDVPSGAAQSIEMKTVLDLPDAPTARATFDANGLAGVVHAGAFGAFEDAILAAPAGHAGIEPAADGRFAAGESALLSKEQFLLGALTTTSRKHRQDLYRDLLSSPGYPERPVFLAWGQALDLGLRFEESAQQKGSALVEIPLTLERPPAGARIRIPSLFVPPREGTRSPSGVSLASVLPGGHAGGPLTLTGEIAMRFAPPAEMAPLQIESASLAADLDAPERVVEIYGFSGGNRVRVFQGSSLQPGSPIALDTFNLDRDPNQGLDFVLKIGEHPDPASHTAWRLDALRLGMTGTVLPRGEAGKP